MKRLFTEAQLRELLNESEFEKFEKITGSESVDTIQSINIPHCWKGLVNHHNLKSALSKCWQIPGTRFDGLAAILNEKTHQLAIAKVRDKNEYSLLYFFLQSGELRTWIGHMPLERLPEIFSDLKMDILPLYKIHNGFYDLRFYEPGYLPAERVEIYRTIDEPKKKGFIGLFEHGASVMGVDLDSESNQAYIIWGNDEEIQEIQSIWVELDKWLVNIIEEYDDISA